MARVIIECLETQVKFTLNPADCESVDIISIDKTELSVAVVNGEIVFSDKTTGDPIEDLTFSTSEIVNLSFPTTSDYFDWINSCLLGAAVSPQLTVQDKYFHVSSTASVGNYDVNVIAGAGTENYTFDVPLDYSSLVSMVLVCFSSGTESGNITLASSYAAVGEDKAASTGSDTLVAVAFTADEFIELDISAAFPNIIAGDNCGVDVTNGLAGNLNVLAVKLRYNSSNGLGGVRTFIGLTDTPASYGGQTGKIAQVNATETGLEFIANTAHPVISANIIPKGTGTSVTDGTWSNVGNDIYPNVTGSNIGDATHRIGTIFMASTVDYANDIVFNDGTTDRFFFTTAGKLGIGITPVCDVTVARASTSLNPLVAPCITVANNEPTQGDGSTTFNLATISLASQFGGANEVNGAIATHSDTAVHGEYLIFGSDSDSKVHFGTKITNFATINMTLDPVNGGVGIGVGDTGLTAGLTAYLDVKASTTSFASLRMRSGANPSAPNSGDMWWNGTNLNFYDGSVTNDLLAGGGGTPGGADTNVQFNNAGAFAGDSNFTWDNTGKQLTLGGAATATANLNLKASGATTATSTIYAESSGGSEMMKFDDVGRLNIGNIHDPLEGFGAPTLLHLGTNQNPSGLFANILMSIHAGTSNSTGLVGPEMGLWITADGSNNPNGNRGLQVDISGGSSSNNVGQQMTVSGATNHNTGLYLSVSGASGNNLALDIFAGGIRYVPGAGNGKVLTSNAGGFASWQTPAGSSNMYTTDGSLTGNRVVTGSSNSLTYTGVGAYSVSATSINHSSSGTLTLSGTSFAFSPATDVSSDFYIKNFSGENSVKIVTPVNVDTDEVQIQIGRVAASTGGDYLVELNANKKALVLTRHANMTQVVVPKNGMIAYDAGANKFKGYENGSWQEFIGAGGSSIYTASGTVPTSVVATLTDTLGFISGDVGFGIATPTAGVHIKGVGTGTDINFRVVNQSDEGIIAVSDDRRIGFGSSPGTGIDWTFIKTLPDSTNQNGMSVRHTSSSATSGYALRVQNNGSSATTNTGLELTATGATNNYAMVVIQGLSGFRQTTPTAVVDIKGVGSTSGTTALNVTESGGNPILVARDDERVGIATSTLTRVLNINGDFNFGDGSANPSRIFVNNTHSKRQFTFEDEGAGAFNTLTLELGTTGSNSELNTSGAFWTTNKNWRFDTAGALASIYCSNSNNGLGINGDTTLGGHIFIGAGGNVNIGNGTTELTAALNVGRFAKSLPAWGFDAVALSVPSNNWTDNSTAGSGTATNAVISSFKIPTLIATNASVTTTNAATVEIEGAPVAGTNQTITNPLSLWIRAGKFRHDGDIEHTGTNVGFFGATPVAQQTAPAAAAGTDAAIIDSIVTNLKNVGLFV